MASYYDAKTAIDYKTLLHHFKQQAAGSRKVALLPSYLMTKGGKKNGGSSIVIVDKPRHEITTPTGGKVPTIEILDDTVASRRRAESQLEREDALSTSTNTPLKHSKASTRGGQPGRKRNYSQLTKNQKVKRARDIFD